MNLPMFRNFIIIFLLSFISSLSITSPRDLAANGANSPAPSVVDRGQPRLLALSSPGVVSIWGGARDTVALKSDGTVWTLGINDCILGTGACGKLGDGTTIERHLPIQVHGPGNIGYLTSITAIMGGEHDNYALKSDGTVWAWGGNFTGQLGNGTWTNSVVPVPVSGLTSVKSLGGRGYHNLALKSDGTVWTWGWNKSLELGYDTSPTPCPNNLYGTCSNSPHQVAGISNVQSVTGGGFFSAALMSDHTLMAWGANEHGQLGDGSYNNQPAPVAVKTLTNVTQVSGGWKHTLALTSDGKVWAWGDNTNGEIGNGAPSTTGINTPYQVPGLSNMIAVSAGDGYSAALKNDGTVCTWGYNFYGQLGDHTTTDRSSPYQVPGVSNVVFLAARDYHTMIIKSDGSIWGWGSDENGELGDNDIQDKSAPVLSLFPVAFQNHLFLPLMKFMP